VTELCEQHGFSERWACKAVGLSRSVARYERRPIERWLQDYNEEIPHDALGDLTPSEYQITHHPETSSN
jgi:transposase InsO family protein